MEIKLYDSFIKRLFGLTFKIKKIEFIACFPKCNSIHTFFMFQAIDVIMTNKKNQVIHMYKNVKPWRIILPKKNVYYTYELPLNTIKDLKIKEIFPKNY